MIRDNKSLKMSLQKNMGTRVEKEEFVALKTGHVIFVDYLSYSDRQATQVKERSSIYIVQK